RARGGGGSRPRPGAVSRGRAARCRALAASPAEVARSARPALGDGEELDAAALELDPRPTLRAGAAAAGVRGDRVCARASAEAAGRARQGDRGPRGDGAVSGSRRVAALLPRHRHAVGDGAAGRDRRLSTLPPAERTHGLPGARAERILLGRDPAAWGPHESRQHARPARARGGRLALSAPPDSRPRAGEPEPGAARGGRRTRLAGTTALASALPPSRRPRQTTAGRRRRDRPRAGGLPVGGHDETGNARARRLNPAGARARRERLDFLRGVGAGAMRTRLESPRVCYATPGLPIGTTRASRRRQLPTNQCHAALPCPVIP